MTEKKFLKNYTTIGPTYVICKINTQNEESESFI